MIKNLIYVFKHTFDYKGRARRREYWMFFLANVLIVAFATVLISPSLSNIPGLEESLDDMEQFYALVMPHLWPVFVVAFLFLLPSLSVMVRRLHDTGKPGWWVAVYYGLSVVSNVMVLYAPQSKLFLFFNYASLGMNLLMIVWLLADSEEGTNDYGTNPKGDEPEEVLE